MNTMAPNGSTHITGTVIKLSSDLKYEGRDNRETYYHYMTVKLDNDSRVYGLIPDNILDVKEGNKARQEHECLVFNHLVAAS